MQSDDFEAAFSHFIDQQEYDAAESALFAVVRAAFLSGWKSACTSSQSEATTDFK